MDPIISTAIAHVRIADLHRDAARRRLARRASGQRPRRITTGIVSLRTNLGRWLASHGRAVQAYSQPEPACCPA
jgi:hypothetical protein